MTTYNYINLSYLEDMVGDDADMKQTMVEMLLTEIPDELAKMQTALADNDLEELFQISHKMKTTLSFIGNETMIEANRTLEHNARHRENVADIPQLLTTLLDLGEKVVAELASVS